MEDQRLSHFISSLPPVDSAQKQAGYDVDILRLPDTGRLHSLEHEGTPSTSLGVKVEEAIPTAATGSRASGPKPPFWRTKRGIVLLVVLTVVIVGAIVGGAVGGTVAKKTGGSQAVATGDTGGLGPNNSNSNQGTSPNGSGDDSG